MENSRSTCFAVSTTRADSSLQMCLSSVLLGSRTPEAIIINFNGEFPGFGSFYLEQLAELARFKGVEFRMLVSPNKGVRKARQAILEAAVEFDLMWMGDDDAIYHWDCLRRFDKAYHNHVKPLDGTKCYLQGSKADVNNRRGYGDFSMEPQSLDGSGNANPNRVYDYESLLDKMAPTKGFDTGNILFDPRQFVEDDISFDPFDDSSNAGGEDTIAGATARSKGYSGWLVPSAIAYHLESPTKHWSVMKERRELILRSANVLNLDVSELNDVYAPYTKNP